MLWTIRSRRTSRIFLFLRRCCGALLKDPPLPNDPIITFDRSSYSGSNQPVILNNGLFGIGLTDILLQTIRSEMMRKLGEPSVIIRGNRIWDVGLKGHLDDGGGSYFIVSISIRLLILKANLLSSSNSRFIIFLHMS